MKNEISYLLELLDNERICYADDFEQKLLLFSEFFLETAKTLNLTAIKQPHDVVIKHYYDSVYPLKFGLFGNSARVIDIGCGAGFPSIPIKLARPDFEMLELDSLKKRLDFLDRAHALLKLEKISTLHARAEQAGRMKDLRDSFDVAVSRAVAPLNMLCEYCLPFVKPGGVFLAYKGVYDKEETESACTAVKALSSETENIFRYSLPEEAGSRTLIVIRKKAPTHPEYPRSTKNMSKGPII